MSAQKRRRKALQRRRWLVELDLLWAYRLERFPLRIVAGSSCSCGRMSWLMEGATDEDRAAFEADSADHDAYCWPEEWAA